MKPHLFVFVGLPASGKSTLRRRLITALGVLQPYVTVDCASTDDNLEAMAEKSGISYKEAFNLHYREADASFMRSVRSFQDKLEDTDCTTMRALIIDRTHTTAKSRARMLMPFNRYGDKIVRYAVYLPTPMPECVRRDAGRLPGRGVGPDVIAFMNNRLEAPKLTEGFDRVVKSEDELLENLNQTAI